MTEDCSLGYGLDVLGVKPWQVFFSSFFYYFFTSALNLLV